MNKIIKTESEWRTQLDDIQYQVTREHATERAWSGKYATNKDPGIYNCVCCGEPLFDSDTKYESGSGWPSFYAPLTETVVETTVDQSFGMVRTEAHCAKCDAHLGHIFDDGPAPTGLRYCMNSASLDLVSKQKTE
jgi:peptide-methionine (R)-S-oxide reductase|tara:strand:- start:27 stop:431 length:405 start_codon:yes stop_codon:yes gene_type:complete